MEVEKTDVEWLIMLIFTLIGKIEINIKPKSKKPSKKRRRRKHKR